MSTSSNQTPDAAQRLWTAIEFVHRDLQQDRRELGKLFLQLKHLYSDRNSGGVRLTSGHGTFQQEIVKRGYKPRSVREWISDYEALSARYQGDTTSTSSEKRKARRQREPRQSKTYYQGFSDAQNMFGHSLFGGASSDPLAIFARLLPYSALKSAYRAALQECHPDHGGSEERTKELIAAWEAVEHFYEASQQYDGDTRHYERTQ